jgi:hypothetical protein
MMIRGVNVRLRFNLSDWLVGIDWFDREMRSWGTRRMVCIRLLCAALVISWGEPD